MALLGIPSGSLIARLGARSTMLLSDAVRAPLIALVPILHWSGQLQLPGVARDRLCTRRLHGAVHRVVAALDRPRAFGDDERTVAKASGLFGGATQLPLVMGLLFAGRARRRHRRAGRARRRRRHVSPRIRASCLLPRPQAGDECRSTRDRGACSPAFAIWRETGWLGPMTLTVIVLDGAAGAPPSPYRCSPLAVPPRRAHCGLVVHRVWRGRGDRLRVRDQLLASSRLRLASGSCSATLPLWVIAARRFQAGRVRRRQATCGFFVPMVQRTVPRLGLHGDADLRYGRR